MMAELQSTVQRAVCSDIIASHWLARLYINTEILATYSSN